MVELTKIYISRLRTSCKYNNALVVVVEVEVLREAEHFDLRYG